MKNSVIILSLLLLSFTGKLLAQSTQSEEYAIVDVLERRKKKIIRITIGDKPATEKEWEVKKTDIPGDLSPVIKELNTLNKQGFKMLNMSTTYETPGGGDFAPSGNPRFTFMMVKKLK